MAKDRFIGMKLLWSWDWRFWSWFTWHGIQSGYTSGEYRYVHECRHHEMVKAPDRIFDVVYHLGPLKLMVGVR